MCICVLVSCLLPVSTSSSNPNLDGKSKNSKSTTDLKMVDMTPAKTSPTGKSTREETWKNKENPYIYVYLYTYYIQNFVDGFSIFEYILLLFQL